jgi:plasmid stabilization system protein ParE
VTYTVVFRPQAEEEARAAQRWYQEQQPGLGARFAGAIDEAIQRIVSNPAAFPVVHGEIRRAVVRRFLRIIFESTLRISSYLL